MSMKSDLEASHGSLDRALKLLDVEKKDLRGKLSKAYNAVVRAAGSTRTAMDIISKEVNRIEHEKEIAEIKTEDMKDDEARIAEAEAESQGEKDAL